MKYKIKKLDDKLVTVNSLQEGDLFQHKGGLFVVFNEELETRQVLSNLGPIAPVYHSLDTFIDVYVPSSVLVRKVFKVTLKSPREKWGDRPNGPSTWFEMREEEK